MAVSVEKPVPAWQRGKVASWLVTVDHKRIGILYGVSAFTFFLIGGLEALLLRIQLGTAENTFLSPELYNQLFTMHGTTMIFLALMPLNAMFFNYLIPLQLGARDVAFPRLNAFSYWVFLLGGLFLNASFLFNAAPNAGWFGYANLTSREFSPGLNADFWMMGLQILGISSLAAAVNFFVTVMNLRAPGMKLMRMPMFTWMSFITQLLILLAFPVITVALIFLMMDRVAGTGFYVPAAKMDRFAAFYTYDKDRKLVPHPSADYSALPALPSGGGGLVSTASDYMRFCQMLLNGGELDGKRILSPLSVQLMRSNVLPAANRTLSPGTGFGLDFAVVEDPLAAGGYGGPGTFYWGGYAGTWFWIDPVYQLIVVGMIQHRGDGMPDLRGLSRSLTYQAIVESE